MIVPPPSTDSLSPQRISLVEEVATLLRAAIRAGRWNGSLPGERQLCQETKVSRPTIRNALAVLEKEGVLARRGQRRREIGSAVCEIGKPSDPATIIRLLSPVEVSGMQGNELIWLDELRRLLAGKDYELRVHVCPKLFSSRSVSAMDSIRAEAATGCWIVYRSNAWLQEWFWKHAPHSVIAGSPYEGVELSCVDVDHRAVCRHAVGRLVQAGHRQICYVGTRFQCAGDLLSEAGFLEGLRSRDEGESRFIRHDGSIPDICAKLDAAMRRKLRPTGFVVANSHHTLTLLCHMGEKGLIAGRDYAMIARDEAPFFEHVTPSVAHYATLPLKIAKELAGLAVKQASLFTGNVTQKFIMPDFIPGRSVADLAALASRRI